MIANLTKNNFKDIVENSTKPVIIDVFASWCGPCAMMKPHFEQLAQKLEASYIFAELNVDESRELAINFNVTSVPTLIFMKDKTIVGREVGYLSKEELTKKIEGYLG